MNYGIEPEVVGEFVTPECQLTYVLYMPVRLAGDDRIVIPRHLSSYEPMVFDALGYELSLIHI